jgi:hypothetical protein
MTWRIEMADNNRCVILASQPRLERGNVAQNNQIKAEIAAIVNKFGGVPLNLRPQGAERYRDAQFERLNLRVHARVNRDSIGNQEGGNGSGGDGIPKFKAAMLIARENGVLIKEETAPGTVRAQNPNPEIGPDLYLPREMDFELAIYQTSLSSAYSLLASHPIRRLFQHVMIVTLNSDSQFDTIN